MDSSNLLGEHILWVLRIMDLIVLSLYLSGHSLLALRYTPELVGFR